MIVEYSKKAGNDMDRLPADVAERIARKMIWYGEQENPLSFAKLLKTARGRLYRFEIGDYRTLCSIEHGVVSILMVLAVRNRKDAYWDI